MRESGDNPNYSALFEAGRRAACSRRRVAARGRLRLFPSGASGALARLDIRREARDDHYPHDMARPMRQSLFVSAAWVILALLLIMPPAAAQSSGVDGELETLRRQASELAREGRLAEREGRFAEREGRFAEAAQLSLRARDLAERQFGPSSPELAATLSDLAYCYLRLRRFSEAETEYQRALAIYDSAPGRYQGEIWLMLERLLEVYAGLGRTDQSAALRARQRDIEQALSAPFDRDIPDLEFITTDLKRVRTHECGAISFKVDDARALLMSFSSIEDVKRRTELLIVSALRRVIGSSSSSQMRNEADRIADEVREALDGEIKFFGYSVRAMPRLGTCFRPINPP